VYQTSLDVISVVAKEKADENDHFLRSLRSYDNEALDVMAHEVNRLVSACIDCTACGNCCKTLVINVAGEEMAPLAAHLRLTIEATKEKYIEESQQGNCFINTIPCHFLADNT